MEKRAVHFIASRTKNYADKRELMNMVNELLGIQYNIAKANRTDRKVQNLAAYINADTLRAIHKTMDRKKAKRMSIRRMVNSSGREKGEKQCLNKNVLTGEVWIMQQSYFLPPAVRKIPEYSGSIVN